ncbi:MAG TPA: hypothetical protein VFR64_10575 [Methylomirabilota bacterium]|nr:hypothetical protein [Methylomirabilota bacterium]
MAWWLAATVLFGVVLAVFALGLPAAFAFFGIGPAVRRVTARP